ncbi:maleylpyruvate isomerase family mycothiol-dependent enzyme [Streptomyces sp. NEAU-sy36]|uniref:maleylpyruvate isomerase family mycothiol-dependent enzyme n=1 Tax=unclassified Streptomyces TaxID=2593676 RepID=UPI0015D63AD7|nr:MULTISPECIES: maleylpyruvate isomerase family mycothiol-dependent enzyme [unclassified Streptomyces]QLJ02464.1 maleylpyruvate isomerase family mycothiol-dependent enzyme [Streptomyces sp. NEAU-sy36]
MTTDRTDFDPATALARIAAATGQLLGTAAEFTDADVRAPSLLPAWSRGHVLTHLARNADGGRHLLTWARTGTETPEYPSLAARAEQIESGAGRGAAELLADLRDSAAAFEAEYRRMPPDGWHRIVRWTRGQERPAARAAEARLCEVLVHHADLDAGYTPAHWPADFVATMLDRVVASFGARDDAPAVRLHATDTGTGHVIGGAPSAPVVRGSQSSLLAWLMGRSPGTGLAADDARGLPRPPFLY